MTEEQRKAYIAGLLRERGYYLTSGDTAAVAGVDAELCRVGHDAQPPAKWAQTRTAR